MSPKIIVSQSIGEKTRAQRTQVVMQRAVDRIERSGRWPTSASPVKILIVPGHSIITSWEPLRTPNPLADPLKHTNLKIEIGEAILTADQAIGSRLIAEGVDEDIVALHLLAHETFHLTEAERMSGCGITAHDSRTGFALGMWPAMRSDWRESSALLARELSSHQRVAGAPTDTQMSAEVLVANDTVSEACADMLGFEIVQTVQGDWLSLFQALVKIRGEDESSRSDSYQISKSLTEIMTPWINSKKIPNEESIVAAAWSYAFDKLKTSPSVGAELRQKIRLLSTPLTYQVKARRFNFLGARRGS
jgi:hypothetical protein